MIENTVKTFVFENRRAILWTTFLGLLVWVALEVQEVTSLVLLAYGISILLDPIVSRLQRFKIHRSLSIIAIGLSFILVAAGLVVILIPVLIDEYHRLALRLPGDLQTAGEKVAVAVEKHFGISIQEAISRVSAEIQAYLAALNTDTLKTVAKGALDAVLRGYSLTLTIINLFFLPFFVFYITRDLALIHRFIGSFLKKEVAERTQVIGNEILSHVYAFFQGQFLVSLIMGTLYIIGLLIVGLPSAVIVGALAGLLNMVPYLGITTGIVLASIIQLVTEPSLMGLLKVWGIFAAVQALEGTVLTPKIVGESVGLHPLGVMLALIVGGQLFGLIGIILAIPGLAAIRVLFRHLLQFASHDKSAGGKKQKR